ncbi:hypothetical protein DY000_02024053 [Brassica cretica]|uniref:Uncharacterized protein n=1 Tax=Brassica cretica TaxID=69181 RepID=A0ABQ7EH88_BRACR|nr:hypothetical protein DY000_02024053 [Brassica cretica]
MAEVENANAILVSEYEKLIVASDVPGDGTGLVYVRLAEKGFVLLVCDSDCFSLCHWS